MEERDVRITALDKKIQALSDALSVKDKQLADPDSLRALQAQADGLREGSGGRQGIDDGLEARSRR